MPRKKRIFIIDDDEYVQELLRCLVSYKTVYDVVSFNDANEALECMERETPDLIMVDYMLPGMTGFEVCKKIRGDERTKQVPLIMMSACARNLGVTYKDAGVDVMLSKPFDMGEVVDAIERFLAPQR